MIRSGEDVTIVEITGHIVITNEPAKVLLKDTISGSITETIDHRIETAFGGIRLPTTIKDLEIIITNLSNLVTVKTNNRDAILFIVGNRSVTRLPIFIVSNRVIHQGFDLAHER